MQPDPWTILDIPPGASAERVRRAWRHQASRWHPDRNTSPEATRRLQQINDAYRYLEGHAGQYIPDAAPAAVILAGVSGTVFGQPWHPVRHGARTVYADLAIPVAHWSADTPVVLTLPLSDSISTLITLVHPGHCRDGEKITFARSGPGADGHVADLVVTLHVGMQKLRKNVSASALARPA
ncbi:MAG TPA: J domain-containing protein [Rhodanobacteraceae bacterium]